MFKKIKKHKKLIITIYTSLATLLSFLSFWFLFYPPNQDAKIRIYTLSKFDLFRVDEPISGIDVSLNGRDLQKEKLNIKIIKLKLINEGLKDLRPDQFIQELPVNLHTPGAKIIHISKTGATGSLQRQKIIDSLSQDSTRVYFNQILISRKEQAFIYVWILHNKSIDPKISLGGRLADASVNYSEGDDDDPFTWEDLYEISLVVVFVIFFVLVIILLGYIYDFILHNCRGLLVKRNLGIEYDSTNISQKLLLKYYKISGKRKMLRYIDIMLNKEVAQSLFQSFNLYKQELLEYRDFVMNNSNVFVIESKKEYLKSTNIVTSPFWKLVQEMISVNLASIEDDRLVVSKDFLEQVELLKKRL